VLDRWVEGASPAPHRLKLAAMVSMHAGTCCLLARAARAGRAAAWRPRLSEAHWLAWAHRSLGGGACGEAGAAGGEEEEEEGHNAAGLACWWEGWEQTLQVRG
jgi:hypothetical protein